MTSHYFLSEVCHDAVRKTVHEFRDALPFAMPLRSDELFTRKPPVRGRKQSKNMYLSMKRMLATIPVAGKSRKHWLKPNVLQCMCVEGLLRAHLPMIYGTEFQVHKEEICREYGIVGEHRTDLAILMERRGGKTIIVSSYAKVFMTHLPGYGIAVYAQNVPGACLIVATVAQYFKADTSIRFKIITDSVREFRIRIEGHTQDTWIVAVAADQAVSLFYCFSVTVIHHHYKNCLLAARYW